MRRKKKALVIEPLYRLGQGRPSHESNVIERMHSQIKSLTELDVGEGAEDVHVLVGHHDAGPPVVVWELDTVWFECSGTEDGRV